MKKSIARRNVLAPQISHGLDLAAEEAQDCRLDHGGKVVSQEKIGMTRDAIRRKFEGLERRTILLEATTQAGWVARLLEELGHDVLVCNPHRLKLIAGSTLKTDKLDAETLARLARLAQLDSEFVRTITVRARHTQLLRSELKGRDRLVACRSQLIAFVRSVLRSDALPQPKCDADHFASKFDLEKLPPDVRLAVEPQVKCIAFLSEQIAGSRKRIAAVAAEIPVVARLLQIPGVGLLTAVCFVLCIEDATRFQKSRDVGPYLGLVPILRQSADQEIRGPITKKGDDGMRRLLVQAALCLLRTRRDTALKQWTLAVAERRGRKKAIVALARKLAVLMHRMWVSGEDYVAFPSNDAAAGGDGVPNRAITSRNVA
jgi:transposase